MTGEDQAHSLPGSQRNDAGIVCEQNNRCIARDASHRPPNVSAIAVIIHPGHIQGCAAKLHCNMLIAKDFYAPAPQCRGHSICPHPEIMVSQDREHPVSCAQATQDFCGRFDIRARISDEVSREHNDVSVKAIGLLHGFGKPFPWQKQSVMDI
jgi:hypothetical protein